MRLFIIRHGETVANIENRYIGHTDSPLTTLGQRQAEELAERLLIQNPELIFHSDLPRAISTAMPLISRVCVPVFSDSRLRELSFGQIEGLNYTQAMEAYTKDMQEWYNDYEHKAPPGGETLTAMRSRVYAFLSDLAVMSFQSAALFTHGGVCKLLAAHATGQQFDEVLSYPGEMTEMLLIGNKDSWTLRKLQI